MNLDFKHVPVMLAEVMQALAVKPGGTYLDMTVGYGGHAAAILAALGPGGLLVGFDYDEAALAAAKQKLTQTPSAAKFVLIKGSYAAFMDHLQALNVTAIDGALIDLGVSSPQIDDPRRGFSYRQQGPLDMRMDKTQEKSANDIVNSASVAALAAIISRYGSPVHARRIAAAIVAARPVSDTLALADVVRKALPSAVVRQKNPAKSVFQALRVAVNNEHEALRETLAALTS